MPDSVPNATFLRVTTPTPMQPVDRKKRACPKCGRVFTRTEHLDRHIRSHNKEKPFRCDDCGNCYSRFDVLSRHRRNADHHMNSESPTATRDKVDSFTSRVPGPTRTLSQQQEASSNLDFSFMVPNSAASQGVLTAEPSILPTRAEDFSSHQPPPEHELAPSRASNPDYAMVGAPNNTWDSLGVDLLEPQFGLDGGFPSWTLDESMHMNIFESSPVADMMVDSVAEPRNAHQNLQTENIKHIWFTCTSNAPAPNRLSGMDSAMPASPQDTGEDPDEVNGLNLSRLQQGIRISSMEPVIPSVDFLNTCIRLYFLKAHALFPVVHPATFFPSKSNVPLTLAICVMGSVFMGSDQAIGIGVHLFERLNKAGLLYGEKLKAKNPEELISVIQGAVIAQIFGLLSGNPNLLLKVDAFHGPPIAWARQQGLFKKRKPIYLEPGTCGADLRKKWLEWAKGEEHVRITHGLSIADAELAKLLHHDPIIRLNPKTLSPSSSDQMFMARTAEEWKIRYLAEPRACSGFDGGSPAANSVWRFDITKIPQNSAFTAYAVLEELNMRITAIMAEEQTTLPSNHGVHTELCSFYHHFLSPRGSSVAGFIAMGINVLWHSVYISTCVDSDLLERLVGREGSDVSDEDKARGTAWAASDDAKRAIAHALLIKKCVESMSLLDEPAIHVPRSLFSAGIVLFCYNKFAPQEWRDRNPIIDGMFPEIRMVGQSINSLFLENRETMPITFVLRKELFTLVQILRRISSWGLSRKFAAILSTMLVDELGQNQQ